MNHYFNTHFLFYCYFIKHPLLFIYIFHEFNVLKKVIITETFNVDFRKKFIKFVIVFQLFFILLDLFPYIHIYLYIYYKEIPCFNNTKFSQPTHMVDHPIHCPSFLYKSSHYSQNFRRYPSVCPEVGKLDELLFTGSSTQLSSPSPTGKQPTQIKPITTADSSQPVPGFYQSQQLS